MSDISSQSFNMSYRSNIEYLSNTVTKYLIIMLYFYIALSFSGALQVGIIISHMSLLFKAWTYYITVFQISLTKCVSYKEKGKNYFTAFPLAHNTVLFNGFSTVTTTIQVNIVINIFTPINYTC